MPVYEYRCNACGKEFEYQQRMSDPEMTVCEACGKEALERLISRTAFSLKGGGWYKDLYSSTKPEAPAAKSDAAPAAAPSTGGGEGGSSPSPSATPAATPSATPSATPAATPTKTGGSGT